MIETKMIRKKNKIQNLQIVFLIISNIITIIFLIILLNMYLSTPKNDNWTYPTKYYRNGALRYYPDQITKTECNNKEFIFEGNIINKDGFRGKTYLMNSSNIGIFGDSTVYGICLRNNETIDFALQNEFDKRNKKYNVINYGIPGYNFMSTAIILDENTVNNKLEYAIIFFSIYDDLTEFDVSNRYRLMIHNKTESRYLETHYNEYWNKEKSLSEESLSALFEKKLKENIIDKRIDKRTKIIFYIRQDNPSQKVMSILEKYNFSYVIMPLTEKKRQELIIPKDGHPNKEYNILLSKKIADQLESLDKKQNTIFSPENTKS